MRAPRVGPSGVLGRRSGKGRTVGPLDFQADGPCCGSTGAAAGNPQTSAQGRVPIKLYGETGEGWAGPRAAVCRLRPWACWVSLAPRLAGRCLCLIYSSCWGPDSDVKDEAAPAQRSQSRCSVISCASGLVTSLQPSFCHDCTDLDSAASPAPASPPTGPPVSEPESGHTVCVCRSGFKWTL